MKSEKKMGQVKHGGLTPEGSNVIAPGKEVRRNPGIE